MVALLPFRSFPRSFVLLWGANLASSLAGWSLGLVVSVHVVTTTGSATAASMLLIAGAAPSAVLGAAAGRVADRFERRRILVLASAARVLLVLGLVLFPQASSPHGLPVVLALVTADALARQVFVPAEQGLLVDVAGRDLAAAVAANSTGTNVARLVAPAAGGAFFAATGFVTTIVGIAMLQALATFLLVPLLRGGAGQVVSAGAGAGAGAGSVLSLLWRSADLRPLAFLQFVDGLKEGALSSLFVLFMVSTVGANAAVIGATNGVFAVGALCAAPLVPWVVRRWGFRVPVAVGASTSSLVLLPVLAAPGTWTALGGFALAGFPFTLSWVAAGTLLLLRAPAAHRSGVVGSSNALWATAVLGGAAFAGPLADRCGVVPVLLVVIVVHAVAGAGFFVLSPPVAGEKQ